MKQHFKTLSTTAGISVLSLLMWTQAANALELQDVLVHTYNTNPVLYSERANLKATDELYNQAFDGFLPTASADFQREHDNIKQFHQAPADQTIGYARELSVNQSLFSGGATVAQLNHAINQIKSEEETLRRTEQGVFINAITAYMDVVQNEEILDISRRNVETLKKSRGSTNERFRLGEVTRTDVAQSSARLSRAISNQSSAYGNLISARAAFKNVTGMDAVDLHFPKIAAHLPGSLDEAIALAKNNPNSKVAEYNVLAAKNGVQQAKANLLPEVSLHGDIRDTTGFATLGNGSYNSEIGTINVSVPIYQGGIEYSRIRANIDNVSHLKEDADSTLRSVVENITRSWEALEVANDNITSTTDAVEAAKVALDGVQQEANIGSRTVLDILDAEQELYLAETSHAQAKHDQIVDSYTLKASIGELDASHLNLPVQVYDPEAHLRKVKYQLFGW